MPPISHRLFLFLCFALISCQQSPEEATDQPPETESGEPLSAQLAEEVKSVPLISLDAQAIEEDRQALVQLFRANPGSKLDWNLEDPDLQQWEGVGLNAAGRVEALRLENKRLKHLPFSIGNLSALKKLDISLNELDSIPDEIACLLNLEVLDIGANHDIRILPAGISKLHKLKTLMAGMNSLERLPAEMAALSSLETIDLSENNIVDISPLVRLNNLKHLYLDVNDVVDIPTDIDKLENLSDLHLSFNDIEVIMGAVFCIPGLDTLSLLKNPIVSLPADYCEIIYEQGIAVELDPHFACQEQEQSYD